MDIATVACLVLVSMIFAAAIFNYFYFTDDFMEFG